MARRLAALALLIVLSTVAVRADDLETVRLAALRLFAWPSAAALPGVVAEATPLAAALNASFYWPDIDYDDPTDRADWKTFVHLGRVVTLVQAYATPGSAVFEDAGLGARLHGALGVWLLHRFQNSNWWYQWIGVPLDMGQIFLMLGANRTSAAEQQQLTDFSFDAAWWIDPWGGGANLVWMIQAELLRGLATRNATAVTEGFSVMWADVSVKSPLTNGQGIMPDGAYHFHGQQPLNYAYGADWLSDVLLFHTCANGTAFDLPPAAIDTLAAFMAFGNAEMSFNRYYDYSLMGRGIDRPGSSFDVPFATAPIRSVAASASSAAVRAAVLGWADRLDRVPGAPVLNSARYYWTSDFLTVHRPSWGASLKAHGNNSRWAVVGGECDNSEDVKGEHQGDGVLSVYGDLSRPGSEYVTEAGNPNAVFPLLDWQLLNGITAEHGVPLEPCVNDVWRVINTEFVGATTAGPYAVFAMDTATHSVTARRSWLFFDDVILALAANISDPAAGVNPRTALATRLLPMPRSDPTGALAIGFSNGTVVSDVADGAAVGLAPGEVLWLQAGSIGYVPFVAAAAASPRTTLGFALNSSAFGEWSSIGAFSGTSRNRFLQAWLDHGEGEVAGESYSYAVFPAAQETAMPALAASLGGVPRICIANAADVQGAAHVAARLALAVFWAPHGGAYRCAGAGFDVGIESDGPAIVVVREVAGASLTVSVSHPSLLAPAAARITVSGRGALSGPACRSGGSGATLFTIAFPELGDFSGATVNATCSF